MKKISATILVCVLMLCAAIQAAAVGKGSFEAGDGAFLLNGEPLW